MNARHASIVAASGRSRMGGFTMVELMVAMLLGLIVIAGVSSVFLANLRSYHSNTALGDVQSNARIAFELMARDIRQAGLTGCNSTSGRVGNVLNNGPYGTSAGAWWASWATGMSAVQGYGPGDANPAITGTPARAGSTDSLTVFEAMGKSLSVATADTAAVAFTLNDPNSDLDAGDIIIVCNPDHATIMQVTAYDGGGPTVTHAVGGATTPGNCVGGLDYDTSCAEAHGEYPFGPNSRISKLAAHAWYIGDNPVGGRSLYRVGLSVIAGVPTPTAQEMVRNVTDLQITYHQSDGTKFLDADEVTDWNTVDAVHIAFTLQSANERAGTDAKPLTRTFASTTAIRNRM